jgi:hypothetical protein
MKIWTWRHAIQQSKLQPTTKLVLFNLSCHMNDVGESCFPSTKKQADDTGLSERSVCTHLDKASEAGFLQITKHGFAGKKWARNEYVALIPYGVIQSKGTEPISVPSESGTEPDDNKALKEIQSNSTGNNSIDKKKNSKKKKYSCDRKVDLTTWEDEHGELVIGHIDDFITRHGFDVKLVHPLVERFRIIAEAKDYKYKNFALAFENAIMGNWFKVDVEKLKKPKVANQRPVYGSEI